MEDDKPPDLDYVRLIRKISPLLWPEQLNLRARVFLCAATLILARVANVMVPQFYKGAVDKLAGSGGVKPGASCRFIFRYCIGGLADVFRVVDLMKCGTH